MHTIRWWLRTSSMIALLLGIWTYAMAVDGQDWGPWGMHMMWGSWGIGMMIMMFLFWAAIIVGIVLLIRWLITAGSPRQQAAAEHGSESALDILKKRYARGEISQQEFHEMRQDLQEGV
jgi:putative membrane protein